MNGADFCHEVDGCPGLYVDAFRGKYLRRTQDPDNAFILTHYHGDHYQNLPRDGKYQGLALIHCTSVTAALLTQVHGIPEMWVIGHEYGQTFSYKVKGQNGKQVAITFYDANHCPGACIVVIQLADGTTHLHTGDMRYHEKFKSYPRLLEAVNAKKLDIVYLDTTYSHPKHDFIPQEEAVQEIADTVVQLLGPSPSSETNSKSVKTLVLLSCYSIGKEKVLWESATRTNQLVYVTEKKMRMLQCVEGHEEVSSQIIRRCTQDSTQTPIHVIPMGLAGELWPFFRPNFQKCAEYAQNLEQGYDKVVAFLPTGWAHGSKWNREHAVSQKSVSLDGNSIHVEVRLIPYSEHSAFTELVSFVQFLRPRKVIPTVFSDQADYRKIENRFRNLLDIKRAKQAFIGSMQIKPVDSNGNSKPPLCTDDGNNQSGVAASKQFASSTIDSGSCVEVATQEHGENTTCYQSDDSVEIVNVKSVSPSKGESPLSDKDHKVSCLVAMGFPLDLTRQVLQECEGDVDQAVDRLLCGPTVANRGTETKATKYATVSFSVSPEVSLPESNKRQKTAGNPKSAPSQSKTLHITSFFTKKTG